MELEKKTMAEEIKSKVESILKQKDTDFWEAVTSAFDKIKKEILQSDLFKEKLTNQFIRGKRFVAIALILCGDSHLSIDNLLAELKTTTMGNLAIHFPKKDLQLSKDDLLSEAHIELIRKIYNELISYGFICDWANVKKDVILVKLP